MNCRQLVEGLNEIVDGHMAHEHWVKVQNHLCICTPCQQLVDHERQIRSALKDLPVPMPAAGWAERALAQAAAAHERQHNQRRWWGWGIPGALAASLTLWLASSIFVSTPEQEVAMDLNEERTIHLVLESPQDLGVATLSLHLPEGIELTEAPGERDLSWQTELRQGKNLLSLRVIAKQQASGDLVAKVEHADKSKTYRLYMDARHQDRSGTREMPGIPDYRA